MKRVLDIVREYWKFVLVVTIGVSALILNFVFNQYVVSDWMIRGIGIFVAISMSIDMIKTLRKGSYGVDILAITAIGATIAVGELWATLMIVVMLTGGEALEDFADRRAKRELKGLLDRAPQIAHIIRGEKISDIKVSSVRPDDILLVKPHEVVPVDSILLSSRAEFDESSLTGESLPVEKKSGDQIMSGSLNGNEAIKVRATATSKNSQYEQIIALVRESESHPAPFVRLADRYAVPFTIISYVIAGTAWAISGDPVRFAEVLVIASPCPLILAPPIAMISGMSRASKNGIIVKNGAILEKMNNVNIMAFDKTGTLTHGDVVVDKIVSTKGFTDKEVLHLSASAEASSSHILATSLVKYANDKRIEIAPSKNVREITGDGVFATVDGKKIIVGRAAFLIKNKIKDFDNDDNNSGTAIFVAIDGKYAGAIYFADQIRAESKKTLRALKGMGILKNVMLTGDRRDTAEKIGKLAGVDKVYFELLPKDKVDMIRNLHSQKGSVAMVGDGVNDAPVLAAADVGIAMGARGSTAASESADIVIMLDDLSRVSLLRKISCRTIRVALQSVLGGIALCIVLMLIAAFGFIPAVIGAVLQELIDVTVIFNALRAHKG